MGELDISNEGLWRIDTGDIALEDSQTCSYCGVCAVCGKSTTFTRLENHMYICNECKDAIKYAKTLMKLRYNP